MSVKGQLPSATKKTDLVTTPVTSDQTEKRVFFLTKDLSKKINEKAKDMFGERRGNASLYIEQAMRIQLHMNIEGVNER